jgi:catechol 2,3-dioxygenase-like lactoylglutathione lyase family enzyme
VVAALNHIHLHVLSVERARDFYAAHFGLRTHVTHGDILFMRDDAGMDLALAPAAALEPFPAWFHIGFRLNSGAEVAALHDALLAAGEPIRQPLSTEPDFVVFRCADPDGHLIEVYWEPQPTGIAS